MWTEERLAVLQQEWPTHKRSDAITQQINALPCAPIELGGVQSKATHLKLKRPPGLVSAVRQESYRKRHGLSQNTAPAGSAPDDASHKPRPFIPSRHGLFSKASQQRYRDPNPPTPDQIAAWIAKNGITICPAAAVEATTADIPMADQIAIAKHQDKLEEMMGEESRQRRASASKASSRISSRQAASVAQRKVG